MERLEDAESEVVSQGVMDDFGQEWKTSEDVVGEKSAPVKSAKKKTTKKKTTKTKRWVFSIW